MTTDQIAIASILGFTRHPASAVWPDLTGEEMDELRKSIDTQGQLHPIIATPDKQIIDGWHRLQVLAELERNPEIETREVSLGDIAEIILGAHNGRRHLSAGDRARLAVKTRVACGEMFAPRGGQAKDSPAISGRSIASDAGVSLPTAQRAITDEKREQGLIPLSEERDPFAAETPPDPAPAASTNHVTGAPLPSAGGAAQPTSPGYTPQPEKGPQTADTAQPDPEVALEKELDQTRALLEEARERIAILEEGVSDEARPLLDKLNNQAELIRTLKSQLNEKTSKLADATRTINALRRKATGFEKQVAELKGGSDA